MIRLGMIMWIPYSLLLYEYTKKCMKTFICEKRKGRYGKSLFTPCNHVEQTKPPGTIHGGYV